MFKVKTLDHDMSRPQDLYKLQQLDKQLDEAHIRLKHIAEELSDNQEIVSAQEHHKRKEDEFETKRKTLSKAERAVQSQKIKIEQTDATLYGGSVRNPKELQDLQQESTALKRFLSTLEDRQLEAMISMEETESELKSAEERLSQARESHEYKIEALNVEKRKLEDKLSSLNSERESVVTDIPTDDLSIYEKIRSQRAGVAVVKVVNKACGACGTTLSAALYQSSRSPSKITKCTTCGRILFAGI